MQSSPLNNGKMMKIRQFTTQDKAYGDSLLLRERLLRIPLGLSLKDEDLTDEVNQMHFGIFMEEELFGSVIFKVLDTEVVKLRQMVIDQRHQGAGIGAILISRVEKVLGDMGFKTVELAARYYAKRFYEKSGYKSVGDIFMEVGLEHVKMIKSI
ncbi:MAG: putative GNAT family N-acyltransferase [Rubritalea sp.]|jgi:predicted GNAT family N-acyltransferase